MAHEVFISYAFEDKSTADAICARLEAAEIKCWIAPRDIVAGLHYGGAIVEAIQQSGAMVLVLSSHSNGSSQVLREIERAVSHNIPIIPLRLENVRLSSSMEYFISSPHSLDCFSGPIDEQHLNQLHVAVTALLKGTHDVADVRVAESPVSGVPNRFDMRRRWTIAAAVFTIAAIVLLVRWLRETPRVLSFAARDWILVSDFNNQTEDQIFDQSLHTAFMIGLEQSRYANVFPDTRINESLKRMKKPDTVRIDEALGREIAVREGVRALVVPNISNIGTSYLLSARIQDPTTGKDVRSEQVRANGKDHVLPGIDDLVAKVRLDLGESLSAITEASKPLAEVTTTSLEALKLFSLSQVKLHAARFAEGKTDLENALRIDPNFTSAKGQLGMTDFEFFNREQGKKLLSDAIQHVDSLTHREKYAISAYYAAAVENNLSKAIELDKLLLALHPDDWSTYNNVGWYSFQLGRAGDAVAAYEDALRLDPYAIVSYNGFVMVYLYLVGDIDAALDLCRKEMAFDDRNWFAHENMGWIFLGKNDLAAAQQSFEKSLEIRGTSTEVRYRLGFTFLLQGRYRDAADMYLSIPRYDATEYESYYEAGIACDLSGDLECQRANFRKFIEEVNKRIKGSPKNAQYRLELAKALVRIGRAADGEAAAQTAIQMAPELHFEIAQFLSTQGKTEAAIDRLELAIKNGFRNFVGLKADPDFRTLQNVPRFNQLISTHLKARN